MKLEYSDYPKKKKKSPQLSLQLSVWQNKCHGTDMCLVIQAAEVCVGKRTVGTWMAINGFQRSYLFILLSSPHPFLPRTAFLRMLASDPMAQGEAIQQRKSPPHTHTHKGKVCNVQSKDPPPAPVRGTATFLRDEAVFPNPPALSCLLSLCVSSSKVEISRTSMVPSLLPELGGRVHQV